MSRGVKGSRLACLPRPRGSDDTYMGYASPAEIVAFLKALAEAQQAGGPVAAPKIHDDALHREL